MNIKVNKRPHGNKIPITKAKTIELNKGITVLVGCNGAGKTTLLNNIKSELTKDGIPVHSYNNLSDGGSDAYGSIIAGASRYGNEPIQVGMHLATSSEGEAIKINIKRDSSLYTDFFKTGYFKDKYYEIDNCFKDTPEEEIKTNIRVLLFDATDSGMSIDAVCETKEFFETLIAECDEIGIELYIVISANEYELCYESDCLDVTSGGHRRFPTYTSYKHFILKSREKKEKRLQREYEWMTSQREKELEAFYRFKASHEVAKKAILAQNKKNLSYRDRCVLMDEPLRKFIKKHKFLSYDLLNKKEN